MNHGKSSLVYQLYPEKKVKDYRVVTINSRVLRKPVEIWYDAGKDLGRVGKILLNGRTVLDSRLDWRPSSDEVFDKILHEVDNDEKLAKNISQLFSFGLISQIQEELLEKKGLKSIKTEKLASGETKRRPTYTHTFADQEEIFEFKTKGHGFKLVEEVLYMKVPKEEGKKRKENPTFFKQKVIITGKLSDLRNRDVENLKCKSVYTREYPTAEKARRADYSGTWLGTFGERESLIK